MITRFIENRLNSLEPSEASEVISMAKGIEGVLKLSGGDPDFDTPNHIRDAAIQAINEGKTHYPSPHGVSELRTAIGEYYSKYGINWSPQEILVTSGSGVALFLAFSGCLNPGDEVLVLEPYYKNYYDLIRYFGAKVIGVPLVEEEGYRLDSEVIKEKISDKTKMILICNPNNPTGTVYSLKELKEIADLSKDFDTLVLSDEAYNEFIYDGNKHHSIAALDDMKERTIVTLTFSKTFAMTGWRLGCLMANEKIAEYLMKIPVGFRTNTFVQYGGLAALKGSWETVQEMSNEFDRRRSFLVKGLNDIDGISCHMPQGSIFTFPNIKDTGINSIELCKKLLQERKILLHPGIAFGSSGEYHLRIPLIRPIDTLGKVIKSIGKIL